METAIDKLKENIQLSIKNTENLIKDLDKKYLNTVLLVQLGFHMFIKKLEWTTN